MCSDLCIVSNFVSGRLNFLAEGRGGGRPPPTPIAGSATDSNPAVFSESVLKHESDLRAQ